MRARAAYSRIDAFDFTTYADSAYIPGIRTGGLGAIVIERHLPDQPDGPIGDTRYESLASEHLISWPEDNAMMSGPELTAVCWGVLSFRGRLRGANVTVY